MKIVKEKIIKLLNDSNKKDYPLELELGLPRGIIYNWKHGVSKPTLEACIKIADYFNISLDELVGRTTQAANTATAPLDDATRELLDGWQNLSTAQKERILGQIQGLQGLATPRSTAELFAEGEAKGRAKVRNQHNAAGEKIS